MALDFLRGEPTSIEEEMRRAGDIPHGAVRKAAAKP
jgi:hypothetical protein